MGHDESRNVEVKEGENLNLFIPCGSWCFVFGLAGLGPNMAPLGCIERKGHDEKSYGHKPTPHRTKVESFGRPKAVFEITWTVD